MKIQCLLFSIALLAACSKPNEAASSPTADPTATNTPPTSSPATADAAPPASAAGVVKAIDPLAKTITLDTGPVAALHWPAMIMTFKTGGADMTSIKPGDHVTFEFTSNGMDATLTKIDRQ